VSRRAIKRAARHVALTLFGGWYYCALLWSLWVTISWCERLMGMGLALVLCLPVFVVLMIIPAFAAEATDWVKHHPSREPRKVLP